MNFGSSASKMRRLFIIGSSAQAPRCAQLACSPCSVCVPVLEAGSEEPMVTAVTEAKSDGRSYSSDWRMYKSVVNEGLTAAISEELRVIAVSQDWGDNDRKPDGSERRTDESLQRTWASQELTARSEVLATLFCSPCCVNVLAPTENRNDNDRRTKNWQKLIENWHQQQNNRQQWLNNWQQWPKNWQQWLNSWQQWLKDWQLLPKNWQQWLKNWQLWPKNWQQWPK